jgi:hypothetical protein
MLLTAVPSVLCCAARYAAEAAGPSAVESADIMALVALNLSRDQVLQQEVGQAAAAGQEVSPSLPLQLTECKTLGLFAMMSRFPGSGSIALPCTLVGGQ